MELNDHKEKHRDKQRKTKQTFNDGNNLVQIRQIR